MTSQADLRERVPCVHTGSYHDKHSGRTIKFCVTKDDDGEWTTRAYARDAREKLKFVDAPNGWSRQWNARRHRVKKAKGRVKSLMDRLDLPVMACPVCGADHTNIHSVGNTNVKEAAFGPKASYEDWSEYSVEWCSECSCNFISKGDYNYSSVKVIADVFDNDAPSAYLSRHFSMSQDRKRKRVMESPEKWQEKLTEFHQQLNDVREYVHEQGEYTFDYL